MPDGSVDCIWKLSHGRIGVTRQSGTNSLLLGRSEFPAYGLKSPPFADSKNRLWITNGNPNIYRADPEGKVALVYSIKQDQRLDVSDPAWHYGEILASEDGKGRVWLWSDSWAGAMNGTALRGVLLFDGEKVEQREKFDGVNNPRFSFIARKDEKHMWLASVKEGLFVVDIDTFKAEPVAEPEPGAFQWVKSVFYSGDDLFVISGRARAIFENSLWRQRAGKWTRLIHAVDDRGGSSFDFDRPWLRVGKEILLCTYEGAPWLIHDDAPPERLDWQSQSTLEDARQVFLLPDGALFGLDIHGTAFHCASFASKLPARPSRAAELRIVFCEWTMDADGTLWAVFQDDANALAQWDGKHWQRHPFPGNLESMHFFGAFADTLGRIWLLPARNDAQGVSFDSHSGKWQTYPNMEVALEALKNDPPKFIGDPPELWAPAFTADKRQIACRGGMCTLLYFNGTGWQQWTGADIEGQAGAYPAMDAPYFDKESRLCVGIGKDTWQLDAQGRWRKQAQAGVEARVRNPQIRPPQGCVTNFPESWAVDNQGVYWLTWRRNLYKCVYGTSVKIFSNEELNPFSDGRGIVEVWQDKGGAVFVRTTPERRIVIAPKSPPPHASLTVTHLGGDAMTARLASDSSPALFRWRMDGEPWQTTAGPLVFQSLPAGLHTLTALATNEELQTGGPVVLKFAVKISPARQVEELIKRLGDPDFANREEAVAALSRQPALALPALEAARDKSDEDQRWWIDAAIQEAERALARAR